MENYNTVLFDSLVCQIGRTVTVFTESGGLSGSGFTGVLLSVDCNVIRLLVSVGAAPACPVGSACTGNFGGFENVYEGNNYNGYMGYPFGAICVIPICAIVCFTHNTI